VNTDGLVAQNGVPVATIRVADVPDRDALIKVGQGLFAHGSGGPLTLIAASGMVRQGTLEMSGVNEIDALMQITSASKSAQSNIGMIDMQNRMLDRLVNTFGRIS
jgi:flagellar basal body rod protein FlgG